MAKFWLEPLPGVAEAYGMKSSELHELLDVAIENKEQIREFLGDAPQSIISQFERWWDKYRVSLHELDEQVKQSEEVMWGHLRELGYD